MSVKVAVNGGGGVRSTNSSYQISFVGNVCRSLVVYCFLLPRQCAYSFHSLFKCNLSRLEMATAFNVFNEGFSQFAAKKAKRFSALFFLSTDDENVNFKCGKFVNASKNEYFLLVLHDK